MPNMVNYNHDSKLYFTELANGLKASYTLDFRLVSSSDALPSEDILEFQIPREVIQYISRCYLEPFEGENEYKCASLWFNYFQ